MIPPSVDISGRPQSAICGCVAKSTDKLILPTHGTRQVKLGCRRYLEVELVLWCIPARAYLEDIKWRIRTSGKIGVLRLQCWIHGLTASAAYRSGPYLGREEGKSWWVEFA